MTTATLSLVSGALTLGYDLSQPTIDAFAYTFTKAQRVARQTLADPASEPYFRAMVGELERLGWQGLLGAAQPSVHAGGGAPTSPLETAMTTLAGVCTAIPSGGFDVGTLSKVRSALEAASDETKAALDRWWSNNQIRASVHAMSMSTTAEVFGMPLLAGGYYSFAMSGASWQALFEPSPDLDLLAYPIVLRLDMDVYRTLEAALRDELQADVRQSIQQEPLDLG